MREIVNTAQNLITVINSTLQSPRLTSLQVNQTRGQHISHPQPSPQTSVQQEMIRSFPGVFQKGLKGKSKFVPMKRKAPKTVVMSFYLLPRMTTKTPKGSDEFKLIEAGLGKRSLKVNDNISHAELSEMLCLEFPKMQGLDGGWLLYKAMGGSGQRPLTVIAPESEGYTGALVQTASNCGKSVLYIVPLQLEIDMTPLPLNSKEFDKMPKAHCSRCNEQMPLQLLAIHVNSCSSASYSDSEESITVESDAAEGVHAEGVHDEGSKELLNCDSDVEFVPPVLNAEPSKKSEYAPCPICQEPFPLYFLEVHASTCGERPVENQGTLDVERNEPHSLDDILQNLAEQVDNSQTFSVCVTRSNFFHRAIQQWKRQKKSTPKCSLKVCFVGEAGIDTGAIKKEFLTDLMNGIELRYFEPGPDNKGKNPIYSISALEESYFRSFGEIIACSLAQGGPAPDFMRNWCYTYLATGDFDRVVLTPEDVTDVETIELIEKVRIATDDELRSLTDNLLSCGYTGLIKTDRKDPIIRTIILNSLARVLPMLEQMRKGLQLYNLPDVMEQHMDLCRPLFVPLQDNKPDANFLMASCKPDFSEKGTSRHNLEQSILNYFQDFLQELEDDDAVPKHFDETEDSDTEVVSNTKTLTVPGVLQWLTGQAHKPVLPSERNNFEIHVKFNHVCQQEAHTICFPIVSACTKTITFPMAHMSSYSEFKHVLTLALRFGNVFGRV
nr:uncharacterized protein LOC129414078 isoform X1 [Misgurnus anguillicaudatus]